MSLMMCQRPHFWHKKNLKLYSFITLNSSLYYTKCVTIYSKWVANMAVAYSTYVIFKTIKNVLLVPDRTRTCAVRRGVFRSHIRASSDLGAARSRLAWLGLAPTSVLTQSFSHLRYPSLTTLPQPDATDDSVLYTKVLSCNVNHC